MRDTFEKVHSAVMFGVDGKTQAPVRMASVNIPGVLTAPDAQVAEYAGVIAGKTPTASFLGFMQAGNAFEIVAVAPANSDEVIDVAGGVKDAGATHVLNFARRLNVEGHGFNSAYAI